MSLQAEIISSQVFLQVAHYFQCLSISPLPPLAHQTPHPYSVESYLPIRPLIIQNTEHLSGSWFYTLFMLGEEESAKHKNHLNSNFMVVDRKSKCTDANFQVALFFFVFLQMTKTNINNKENASPLTPWCEYLQNVEIHCKSALTLFRLRFCKAAIFMAWPQRRARKHKRSQRFSQLGRFRLPLNPDLVVILPPSHIYRALKIWNTKFMGGLSDWM